MKSITRSWIVAKPAALFVASAVAGRDSLVVTAAGGAESGAVALVALFIPGCVHGAIALLRPPSLS